MERIDCDVLVIGWGKAGKSLARAQGLAGRHVVMVEQSDQMYGGTCINIACVPTKALVHRAGLRRDDDPPAPWFTDAAGVDIDERGFVRVDERLRTSAEGVFAVGDVNGGPQFTYVSYDDHRIVLDQLAGSGTRRTTDRVAVPTTTFLTPPLSRVGLSETEARERGLDVHVVSKPVAAIAAMPRPKIVGETHGLIKFVVDAKSRMVLGAVLFCVDSQELVNLVALAMRAGVRADQLRDGIWTHPSSTESMNEVLAALPR